MQSKISKMPRLRAHPDVIHRKMFRSGFPFDSEITVRTKLAIVSKNKLFMKMPNVIKLGFGILEA